jgi:hypothetical protein
MRASFAIADCTMDFTVETCYKLYVSLRKYQLNSKAFFCCTYSVSFLSLKYFMVSEPLKENSSNPATMASSPASSSSSAPATNTLLSSAPVTTTFTLPSISQQIPTKLDGPADYLNWVSHFNPILNSHELMGFVDGSEPCPPKYVTDETGNLTTIVNPDYSLWHRKDQCILSWFNTTMSDRMLSSLYGLKTARQVWTTLATRYASQSKARISYLKRQLQTLNQGSKTCLEFLNETKSCASLLAAAGQPIEDDDLISYVLGGLNSSYTTFITLFNFTTRTSSMTFEEFQCELLNHEILLNNHLPQQQPLTESGNFALYTQKPRPSNNNYHKGKAVSYSKNSYQPRNAYQPNQSRGYPRNNYQSNLRRPGGNHFSSQSKSVLGAPPTSFPHRPSCQICGKPGHLALDCYHRMDYSYQGKNPPSQFAAMVARAHSSALEQNDEEPWYADSGANNHVTAALDNLTL